MSNSQEHPSAPGLIEQVIGSGLFSFDDEPHFSWQGCEHCADGLGATVYDLQGYRSAPQPDPYGACFPKSRHWVSYRSDPAVAIGTQAKTTAL